MTTTIDFLSPIALRPQGRQRITDHSIRTEDPTGDQGTALYVDYSPFFAYTGVDGPKSSLGRAIVEVTGTAVYAFDMEPNGAAPVGFRNEHRIKNDTGSERNLAPAWSFISQPGYQADAATVFLSENDHAFEQVDFWAEPFYLTKDGGVIDGTTLGAFTSKSYSAGIWLQGNVDLYGWIGYEVRTPRLDGDLEEFDAGAGVIHHVLGIYVPDLIEGSESNRAVSLGAGGLELRASAEPDGDLDADAAGLIYVNEDGKLVVKYNDGGTVRYKSLDLNGTGVTWVHSLSAP